MSGEAPKFLYHYTSINTLGLILKYKSIRFNSLAKMDDLDEKIVLNKELGKYTFVSCWTEEEKESIPMWQMYSDGLKGVRIKIPIQPFEVYLKDGKEYIISPNELIGKNYYFHRPFEGVFYKPVSYETIPQIENIRNGEMAEKNRTLFGYNEFLPGMDKNNYWEFQKEWRYMLRVIPSKNPENDIKNNNKDTEYIDTLPKVDIEFKDLHIREDALKQMEIMLGPKTNEIDKRIVELLIKDVNLNKDIKIKESELKNRI